MVAVHLHNESGSELTGLATMVAVHLNNEPGSELTGLATVVAVHLHNESGSECPAWPPWWRYSCLTNTGVN